eukprot:7625658-Alexandrium_andersonii.AAC.1
MAQKPKYGSSWSSLSWQLKLVGTRKQARSWLGVTTWWSGYSRLTWTFSSSTTKCLGTGPVTILAAPALLWTMSTAHTSGRTSPKQPPGSSKHSPTIQGQASAPDLPETIAGGLGP